MKKTVLALLFVLLFVLGACNDSGDSSVIITAPTAIYALELEETPPAQVEIVVTPIAVPASNAPEEK